MLRFLPAVVALSLVAAYGVFEGLWTERWGPSANAGVVVERLAAVPLTVGEWEAQELTLSPREVEKAEISGYLSRQYVHRPTGNTLTVLLVCGRPGPVSLHTPD